MPRKKKKKERVETDTVKMMDLHVNINSYMYAHIPASCSPPGSLSKSPLTSNSVFYKSETQNKTLFIREGKEKKAYNRCKITFFLLNASKHPQFRALIDDLKGAPGIDAKKSNQVYSCEPFAFTISEYK
jgi:hypothetical protein